MKLKKNSIRSIRDVDENFFFILSCEDEILLFCNFVYYVTTLPYQSTH